MPAKAPEQPPKEVILNNAITTAQSAVACCADDLESAMTQLTGARATVAELDAQLDTSESLPKGHAGRMADAQAQVDMLTRLVSRREAALSDARASLANAEAQATADRIDELGDILAGFDRGAFITEVLAEIQPVLDKHLEHVHDLRDAERELRSLAGKNPHPTSRVSINRGGGLDSSIDIDGTIVYPAAPQILARDLGGLLRDSRYEAEVHAALTEQREAADAERQERAAEAKAFRESENVAKWGTVKGAPAAVRKTDKDGKATIVRR